MIKVCATVGWLVSLTTTVAGCGLSAVQEDSDSQESSVTDSSLLRGPSGRISIGLDGSSADFNATFLSAPNPKCTEERINSHCVVHDCNGANYLAGSTEINGGRMIVRGNSELSMTANAMNTYDGSNPSDVQSNGDWLSQHANEPWAPPSGLTVSGAGSAKFPAFQIDGIRIPGEYTVSPKLDSTKNFDIYRGRNIALKWTGGNAGDTIYAELTFDEQRVQKGTGDIPLEFVVKRQVVAQCYFNKEAGSATLPSALFSSLPPGESDAAPYTVGQTVRNYSFGILPMKRVRATIGSKKVPLFVEVFNRRINGSDTTFQSVKLH